MDLAGKRIAIYGRLLLHSRRFAIAQAEARGVIVERDLTRRSNLLVAGRGTLNLVPSGHLLRKLHEAIAQGVPIIGETRFWALLEGQEPAPPTYPLDRIAPAPPADLADHLNAFDIVHIANAACRFGDVQTFRTAMSLEDGGHETSSILRILLHAQKVTPEGRHRIVTDGGEPMLEWEDGMTALDGQGLLPLPDQPGLDDLFDQALLAEAEGQLDRAARLYEICTGIDKRDPIGPFNLGNVLSAQGKTEEAIHRYGQAVARDPMFAESYYNRARLREKRGDLSAAMNDLRLALNADPDYSHALFNLAQLELQANSADTAVTLFDRFLSLGPDPDWRTIAIKARAVAARKSIGSAG